MYVKKEASQSDKQAFHYFFVRLQIAHIIEKRDCTSESDSFRLLQWDSSVRAQNTSQVSIVHCHSSNMIAFSLMIHGLDINRKGRTGVKCTTVYVYIVIQEDDCEVPWCNG